MEPPRQNFGNHLLIALPALRDRYFERSVTLICQHDADGAMGIVVNRASEYTVGEVLRQMGIASEDPALLQDLIRRRVPLTVCPLSNLKLGVVHHLRDHNLAKLLRAGAVVTLNSDDPAYFGGYVLDNYIASADALDLSRDELVTLAANSLKASFLPSAEQAGLLDRLSVAAGQG